MRSLLTAATVLLFSFGAALLALFFYEETLIGRPPPARTTMIDRTGIVEMELYPYTGFHTQANYRHKGDMPWERQPYHDYDIRSGDLGFFDFSLKEAYPKKPNEFRIILTGGSGAQGWGAQTNEHMLHRLLPRYLSEKLVGCGVEVTLFNMAMGSATSYQNYIALNRWGHRLQPDMILSYSGRNDVAVPFTEGTDAFFYFPAVAAYVLSSRPSESRGGIAWLVRHFPAVTEHTTLGRGLRVLFDYEHYVEKAYERYRAASGRRPEMGEKAFFETVVKPDYLHAMQSLKRDFDGIPIAIAWQAVRAEEWLELGLTDKLGEAFYREWFAEVREKLAHYQNDEWYFLDANAHMQAHPQANTGTHLGNAGQETLSRFLAGQLAAPIRHLKNCSAE